jgi:ABC-type Fe3+ transport system permease subunit
VLLPRWLVASAWAVFGLAALLPLLWLGLDVVRGEGGLSALRDLLLTQAQWRLLARSLVVAGGAALLALGLGVPYALAIERTRMPGRHAFRLALGSPSF